LHGERLYTRPFHPGMDPRIDHLAGPDRDLAATYVEDERARQERLVASTGADPGAADEAWRLLQVWDRLSLLVCMSPLRPGTKQALPPVATRDGDAAIEAFADEAGQLVCRPYPFRSDPEPFEIPAVRTTRRTWDSEAAYRDDFRAAERYLLTFVCRS